MTTDDRPRPTHQVVKCNVATGGRVSRVSGVEHFDKWTAQNEADSRNARENRAGRNVKWVVRSIDRNGRPAWT
jgi:hypothetical protein